MNRKNAILVFAAVLAFAVSACTKKETAQTSTSTSAVTATSAPAANATELKIEELKVGTGTEAVAGKVVTVNYTGWLTNGTKFDSSLDHGQPIKFLLGAGRVIPGWEKGLVGMKVGGKRKLTIPPQLGYGEQGAGNVIPPNATLIFEVELVGVDNP
jgi:peptidylprolyl isomerase